MHVLDKADPVCWLQPFNETLGGHDSEKCSGHQKPGWNPVGARDYQPRYAVLLGWCHRPLGCQSWARRNVSLIFFQLSHQCFVYCLFPPFWLAEAVYLQGFYKNSDHRKQMALKFILNSSINNCSRLLLWQNSERKIPKKNKILFWFFFSAFSVEIFPQNMAAEFFKNSGRIWYPPFNLFSL